MSAPTICLVRKSLFGDIRAKLEISNNDKKITLTISINLRLKAEKQVKIHLDAIYIETWTFFIIIKPTDPIGTKILIVHVSSVKEYALLSGRN